MYKIPAKTLFLGKNLIFLPECHSTNDMGLHVMQTTKWFDGTIIITDNQTAGRGQRGNSWLAEAGKNLTFSMLLKPSISVSEQFILTQFVALGICDYLTTQAPGKVQIKWPNDIMIDERKVGGILIENHIAGTSIAGSVIGIGLNVNQTTFPLNTACSLALVTHTQYNLPSVLDDLLFSIEKRWLKLKEDKYELLNEDYHKNLFRLHEPHRYQTPSGEVITSITGVDRLGRLTMSTEHGPRIFNNKEIQYLFT